MYIGIIAHSVLLICNGIPFDGGTEPHYWDSHSVIVAKVSDATITHPGTVCGDAELTLLPIATLTGSFDSTVNSEIKATLCYGWLCSNVLEPPKPGATVVILLNPHEKNWEVSCAHVDYLPNNRSLNVIDEITPETLQPFKDGIRLARLAYDLNSCWIIERLQAAP